MPIKPGSSAISYDWTSGSGTFYVDELTYTEVFQDFDRLEFSNARLRQAPTLSGALPLIVTSFGNQPIQLLTTCTGDVPRPLTPDDANISNIKKRWNIKRFTMKGSVQAEATVNNLYDLNASHLVLLNGFDLYLGELNMELSITYLETVLQPLTFSTLTTTDFSISGEVLNTTYTNMLLTQFDAVAEYESDNSPLMFSFTATIENRILNSQGPLPS